MIVLDTYFATEMPTPALEIYAEDDGTEWHIFQRNGDGKFLVRPFLPGDGYPTWEFTLFPTIEMARASVPTGGLI